MKRLYFLLLLTVCIIVGCGKIEDKDLQVDKSTNTYYLTLSDSQFFMVKVPSNLEVKTDYSKFISDITNRFGIVLYGDTTLAKAIDQAGIVGDFDSTNMIVESKNSQTGYKLLSKLGDTHVLYLNVFDLDDFDLYESLRNNILDTGVWSTPKSYTVDKTNTITKLPEADINKVNIQVGTIDYNKSDYYTYDDGFLYVTKQMEQYDSTILGIENRLSVVSQMADAKNYFKGKSRYYVEMGDFVAGILKVDFNTVIILWGKGDSARCNIIYYMKDFGV